VEFADDFTHIRGRHTIQRGADETGYKMWNRVPSAANVTGFFGFKRRLDRQFGLAQPAPVQRQQLCRFSDRHGQQLANQLDRSVRVLALYALLGILLRRERQPRRKPAIFLHGGPRGGSDLKQRRFFHPDKYRIVNFDQRGCGKSTPYASLERVAMASPTSRKLTVNR